MMNAHDPEEHEERLQRAKAGFRKAALAVSVIDGLEKMLVLVDAMLTSKHNSDVIEAINTLIAMQDAGIKQATEGLAKALQLINRPGLPLEVELRVMAMFHSVYMSHVRALLFICHHGRAISVNSYHIGHSNLHQKQSFFAFRGLGHSYKPVYCSI